MKTTTNKLENNEFLNVSEQNELHYWSDKLGVRPEVIKTAVRASRSNTIVSIVNYLEHHKTV